VSLHLSKLKFEGKCVEFFRSNILLIGLALGSGLMLLLPLFKKSAGGVPNLTAAEAVTLINRSNALVLDVRDDAEFASGHIAEAMHIPLADLPARIAELKKYQHKTILLNCQRGMRSAKACDILRKAEFTQLNNLHGGLNAWIEAKLPVVTNAKATSAKAANAAVKKAPAAKSVAKPNVAEVAVEASTESVPEKGAV
jgi:rhodanese-related sulfurtransferase